MPNIQDSLGGIGGFQFATVIDLSMGYYDMMLGEESHKICMIVLPWGNTRIMDNPW